MKHTYLSLIASLIGTMGIAQAVVITNDGTEFETRQFLDHTFVWEEGNAVQNQGIMDNDTGILTTEYFAQFDLASPFFFDTKDNTRFVTSIDWTIRLEYNEYTLNFDPSLNIDTNVSYVRSTGSLAIYDLSGSLLDTITRQVEELHFTQGDNAEQDSMLILSLGEFYEADYVNSAVFGAVSDGGIRIEFTETWDYYMVDTDGNVLTRNVVEYIDLYDQVFGSPNDYDSYVRYNWDYDQAPEPSSIMLLGVGGIGFLLRRKW